MIEATLKNLTEAKILKRFEYSLQIIILNSFEMKTFMTLCLLMYLSQCAYFDQLPIDPTLSTEANQAINSLLSTLKSHLDCSLDDAPRDTRAINNHLFNTSEVLAFCREEPT